MKKIFLLCISILILFSTELYSQWTLLPNAPLKGKVNEIIYDEGILYAGTAGEGLWASSDNGDSWYPLNSGISSDNVYSIDIKDNVIAIASFTRGGAVSTDKGATWKRGAGLESGIYYTVAVGNGNILLGTTNGDIYHSADSGKTWTKKPFQIGGSISLMDLAYDGNIAYAAVYPDGFVVSSDHGDTWIKKNASFEEHFKKIRTIWVDNGRIFVASQSGGIYLSTDKGESWTLKSSGFPKLMYSVYSNDNYVFAGSVGSGIFFSKDNGESWAPQNKGMNKESIIKSFASNGEFVFVVADSSVYRAKISEFSMTAIEESVFNNLIAYPNPAGNIVNLVYPEESIANVEIFNQAGRIIKTIHSPQLSENKLTIDASELASGMYCFRARLGNKAYNYRIIIKRD